MPDSRGGGGSDTGDSGSNWRDTLRADTPRYSSGVGEENVSKTTRNEKTWPDREPHDGVIGVDSEVWTFAWGRGDDGQLGLGRLSNTFAPRRIPALDSCDVASLACGGVGKRQCHLPNTNVTFAALMN